MIKIYLKSAFLSIISVQMLMHGEPSEKKAFFQKIVTGIRASTNYLLSSGDASADNTIYTHQLFRQIDAESDLPQVKKMNKVIEYLLGYKNTLVLPGLNQIYLSENWINELPEEQKKFVLGRCLAWINKGQSYLTAQTLMALTTYLITRQKEQNENELLTAFKPCTLLFDAFKDTASKGLSVEDLQKNETFKDTMAKFNTQFEFFKVDQSDNLSSYPNVMHLYVLNKFITNYIHRNINYDADTFAATKFDCAQGGIDVMRNIAIYKDDQTILGKIFSTVPVTYLISSFIEFLQSKKRITSKLNGFSYHPNIFATSILIAQKLITSASGRLHNNPNVVGNRIKNLPLINLGSSFPQKDCRISALKNIQKA